MTMTKYMCINCGKGVKELYKKYSPTVLKLSNCEFCNNVADKYVEYDPIIIILDLVLLSKEAYRHLIFNTDFKIHWKLVLLLQVVETYTEWKIKQPDLLHGQEENHNKVKINSTHEMHPYNLEFYNLFLTTSLKTYMFILSIMVLTWSYNKIYMRNNEPKVSLMHVWKCITLSSFGMFLFLLALIWGQSSVQEYHIVFVSLYTTFSQLISYKVIMNCNKLWSIIVIVVSYYIKYILIGKFDLQLLNFELNILQ